MTLIPWLVALSVGLAVFGGGGLLYGYFAQAQRSLVRQRQLERFERLVAGNPAPAGEDGFESLPLLERLAQFLTGRMYGDPKPEQDSEERLLLVRAGYRSLRALLLFRALRLVLPIAALIPLTGYALLTDDATAWVQVFAACAVLYLGPKPILAHLAKRRCHRLAEEIPMFVDYLRMMHSVGISLEQSLVLFAEDRRVGLPVLSSELHLVNLAIRSGRSRADALHLMAEQLDIAELKELIALLIQAERYGATIQEPLRSFSQRLSERKRFELQEYVGRMANKMVVVMVLCLLPALLIVTAGPGFLAVAKTLTDLV